MGSPETEAGRDPDEGPRVAIELSQPIFVASKEVTQAEFMEVMGFNPSFATGDPALPVEQVTWEDATNYCFQLTQREKQGGRLPPGYEFRLPTEAEWEYAARAGSTNRFSFGDDPEYVLLRDYALCLYNALGITHGVGGKHPNLWGLYDIYGNVAEWCLDGYGPYPGGSVIDQTGPPDAEYHVMRGGSAYDTGVLCRSAFRLYDWTEERFYNVGFRVVLAKKNL